MSLTLTDPAQPAKPVSLFPTMYRRAVRETRRIIFVVIAIPLIVPIFTLIVFSQVFAPIMQVAGFSAADSYVQYIAPGAILMAVMLSRVLIRAGEDQTGEGGAGAAKVFFCAIDTNVFGEGADTAAAGIFEKMRATPPAAVVRATSSRLSQRGAGRCEGDEHCCEESSDLPHVRTSWVTSDTNILSFGEVHNKSLRSVEVGTVGGTLALRYAVDGKWRLESGLR